MKQLKDKEIERLGWNRPKLEKWLQEEQVTDVFTLTDAPTGPEEDRWGRRNLLLVARGKKHIYMVMDRAGTKSKPEDTMLVWLGDSIPIGAKAPETNDKYVVIERSKLGRPRTELTAEKREEILARHKQGQGINKIAMKMHLSTKRISEVIKQSKEQEEEA